MKLTGGRRLKPRALETNVLFDTPSGSLRAQGRSLRVRLYGAEGSVTLKGAASAEGGIKTRQELETGVTSAQTLTEILLSLGFAPAFRYEKFREVWEMGSTAICLDETPMGLFVEIEGARAGIRRVAATLGFGPAEFMSASYPALWAAEGGSGAMVFPPAAKRASRRADS